MSILKWIGDWLYTFWISVKPGGNNDDDGNHGK